MKTVTILNRKARYNYEILTSYHAGIQLREAEIKSIRGSQASISEAYCLFKDNELWLVESYVKPYFVGWINPKEKRDRKLLLTKRELRKLEKDVQTPGYSIIPLKMYINARGLCKVKIALCRGKKEYDKRETIKARDNKRELDKIIKNY